MISHQDVEDYLKRWSETVVHKDKLRRMHNAWSALSNLLSDPIVPHEVQDQLDRGSPRRTINKTTRATYKSVVVGIIQDTIRWKLGEVVSIKKEEEKTITYTLFVTRGREVSLTIPADFSVRDVHLLRTQTSPLLDFLTASARAVAGVLPEKK